MRYVEFVRREENTIWGHISFGHGTTQWSTNRTKVENLFIGSNGLGMCQKWWKLVLPNGSTILRMLATYITSLFHSFPSLQIPSLIQFDSEKRFQWNIELFHPIVLYRNMFRFSDSNREKNPIRFLHVQLFQLNIVCCPVHTSTVMALDAFEWNRRVTMRVSNSCNWMLLLRVKSLEIFTRCNDFSSLFFCWRVSVLLSAVSEADILRFTFPFHSISTQSWLAKRARSECQKWIQKRITQRELECYKIWILNLIICLWLSVAFSVRKSSADFRAAIHCHCVC